MQRPLTILGLPPALLIGTACAAGMVMLLFVYVGLLPLALPAFILSFAWLWWKLWRRQQADGHFGSVLFAALRFWGCNGRWSAKRTQLVAGMPYPVRKRRQARLSPDTTGGLRSEARSEGKGVSVCVDNGG